VECSFPFLSDVADGGGNYDVSNNAVIATPGPQISRSQNASFRHSWEMNYQEAAIYLQVRHFHTGSAHTHTVRLAAAVLLPRSEKVMGSNPAGSVVLGVCMVCVHVGVGPVVDATLWLPTGPRDGLKYMQ